MESISLYHEMNEESVKLENIFKSKIESAKQWAVEYLEMIKEAKLNENKGDRNMDLIVKTPAMKKQKRISVSKLNKDLTCVRLFDDSDDSLMIGEVSNLNPHISTVVEFNDTINHPCTEVTPVIPDKMSSTRMSKRSRAIKKELITSPTTLAKSSIDIPVRQSTRIRNAPSKLGITPCVDEINKTSPNKKRQRTNRKQNTPEIEDSKCNIIKLEQNIDADDNIVKQNKHNASINQESNILDDVVIPNVIVESPKPKQPKTRRTTRATAETRRNSRIAAAAAQQSQKSKLGQVSRSEVLSNNSDDEDDTRFIDAKTSQELKSPVITNTPQSNVSLSTLQKKSSLKRKSGKRRSKLANLSVSFKESDHNLSSDGDVYMSDFGQENLKKQLSADEDENYQPIEKQAKSKVSIQKDQSKIFMQLTPKLFVPVKQHAILAMDCDDDDFVDKDEEDISVVKDNIMNGNEDCDKVDSSKVDNGKEDNNKEEAKLSRTEDISDSNEQFTDACDDSPMAPVTRSLNATITLSKGDAGVAMDNSNDNRNSNNKDTNDRKVNTKTSKSNSISSPDSPATPPKKPIRKKKNTTKEIQNHEMNTSVESLIEVESHTPLNSHRSITGFSSLTVKQKAKAMQDTLDGGSPRIVMPRSNAPNTLKKSLRPRKSERKSTRRSILSRKTVVKPKGPYSKKIEAIIQAKTNKSQMKLRHISDEQNINPNTPKATPIIQKKKPVSVMKTLTRNNSALKSRNTPMAIAKAELRTKEMLSLKEKEKDERIRNLHLKRQQLAEEHKKMREVKAMEAANRRALQKATKTIALSESVKKKESDKRQLDQRAQMLQERSRLERELWKKKQDEIEAKKKSDEKKRIQRILEIEAEKKQHEEIKKLKFEKSQKECQRRMELAMMQAQLRQEQSEEENVRIAESSRLADIKLMQDIVENKQKKIKEKERILKEKREKAREILRQDDYDAINKSSDNLSERDQVSNLSTDFDDVPVKKNPQCSTMFKKNDYSIDLSAPTPVKTHTSHESYDIDNLNEDSTDDESNPKNRIPNWAEFSNVRKQLLQHKTSPQCINDLFPKIKAPVIEEMFVSNKIYKPRTSSAVWDSPMYK